MDTTEDPTVGDVEKLIEKRDPSRSTEALCAIEDTFVITKHEHLTTA